MILKLKLEEALVIYQDDLSSARENASEEITRIQEETARAIMDARKQATVQKEVTFDDVANTKKTAVEQIQSVQEEAAEQEEEAQEEESEKVCVVSIRGDSCAEIMEILL